MIDLYIGLRVNQFAILCGPQISGKSTIWNVVAKTINSTILNSDHTSSSVSLNISQTF